MIVLVRKQHLLLGILVILMAGLVYKVYTSQTVNTFSLPTSHRVIVIDPGHGGRDPGMVGGTGVLEKEINLQISQKLQGYLEQSGAYVITTRIDDSGLYLESDSNKKRADLKKRKEIINEGEADLLISIHQNSFEQSKYSGAQVFYYENSEPSKQLAELIQEEIKTFVDPDNDRKPKSNGSYYMLKETVVPGVIIECGFLSNLEEERNLKTEEYQEKIAWAIYVGIIKYFHEVDQGVKAVDVMNENF